MRDDPGCSNHMMPLRILMSSHSKAMRETWRFPSFTPLQEGSPKMLSAVRFVEEAVTNIHELQTVPHHTVASAVTFGLAVLLFVRRMPENSDAKFFADCMTGSA